MMGFALLWFHKNDKHFIQEVLKKSLTAYFANKIFALNLKVTINFRQNIVNNDMIAPVHLEVDCLKLFFVSGSQSVLQFPGVPVGTFL